MRAAFASTVAAACLSSCLAFCLASCHPPDPMPPKPPHAGDTRAAAGVLLVDLSWQEAERVLGPDTVVVIPIGAASKEHGPHLKLSNDFVMAEYLKGRVARDAKVVVAPTVPYHFYPAFVNYPGSTTLRLETARDLMIDVVRSLAKHGPRRFYALNTGVSTVRALAPTQEALAKEGILFRYTNLLDALGPLEKQVSQQARGTHADEIETSMMLYIAPETVDMTKAVKDDSPDSPERKGPLVRRPDEQGLYSPTGTWGDPTLATRAKGEKVTEGLVAALLRDVELTRTLPLPAPASPTP